MSNALELVPLELADGKPVVSSLKIAEHFNKHHYNVLQSIESLKKDCPKKFTELNFQFSEYKDSTGRKLPFYNLTRDGFTLLVMGFTGKTAIEWKIRYIEAFNALERAVLESIQLDSVREGFRLCRQLPPKKQAALKNALRYHELGLSYREIAKLLDTTKRTAWHLVKTAQVIGLEAI